MARRSPILALLALATLPAACSGQTVGTGGDAGTDAAEASTQLPSDSSTTPPPNCITLENHCVPSTPCCTGLVCANGLCANPGMCAAHGGDCSHGNGCCSSFDSCGSMGLCGDCALQACSPTQVCCNGFKCANGVCG